MSGIYRAGYGRGAPIYNPGMVSGVVLWVLLGVAALLVAAVIVVLVIMRRRNGSDGYDLTPEAKDEITNYNQTLGQGGRWF